MKNYKNYIYLLKRKLVFKKHQPGIIAKLLFILGIIIILCSKFGVKIYNVSDSIWSEVGSIVKETGDIGLFYLIVLFAIGILVKISFDFMAKRSVIKILDKSGYKLVRKKNEIVKFMDTNGNVHTTHFKPSLFGKNLLIKNAIKIK